MNATKTRRNDPATLPDSTQPQTQHGRNGGRAEASDVGPTGKKVGCVITPLKMQRVQFHLRGTAPYMQCRFSQKALDELKRQQEIGSASKSKKKREPKDFEKLGWEAAHSSTEGWIGQPSSAYRNAMISACKGANFMMTRAKIAIFPEGDGFDDVDLVPLVKFAKGEPRIHIGPVRLDNGVIDIRPRPLWDPGWEVNLRVKFDADMFQVNDIAELLNRAGQTVGIGEGRHDSRHCNGMGFGTWEIVGSEVF